MLVRLGVKNKFQRVLLVDKEAVTFDKTTNQVLSVSPIKSVKASVLTKAMKVEVFSVLEDSENKSALVTVYNSQGSKTYKAITWSKLESFKQGVKNKEGYLLSLFVPLEVEGSYYRQVIMVRMVV